MNSRSFSQLVKNLQLFYKCPLCGAGYKSEDIAFLGQVDDHCFMKLSCHACTAPVLATVFLNSDIGPDGRERSTTRRRRHQSDLKPREKAYFIAKGEIESGEIADFHRFLSEYQGNLTQL